MSQKLHIQRKFCKFGFYNLTKFIAVSTQHHCVVSWPEHLQLTSKKISSNSCSYTTQYMYARQKHLSTLKKKTLEQNKEKLSLAIQITSFVSILLYYLLVVVSCREDWGKTIKPTLCKQNLLIGF